MLGLILRHGRMVARNRETEKQRSRETGDCGVLGESQLRKSVMAAQGLKPEFIFEAFAARLKVVPCYKAQYKDFFPRPVESCPFKTSIDENSLAQEICDGRDDSFLLVFAQLRKNRQRQHFACGALGFWETAFGVAETLQCLLLVQRNGIVDFASYLAFAEEVA